MRYYLLDGEDGSMSVLENIIENRDLGQVAGYSADLSNAGEEILILNPDMVLIDWPAECADAEALVRQIRQVRPQISFIGLSAANDKATVERAYRAGVEFVISRPISAVEVEKVLGHVAERIEMGKMVEKIRAMVGEDTVPSKTIVESENDSFAREINLFLSLLGMLGEKGTAELVEICRRIASVGGGYRREILLQLASDEGISGKNLEQQIRRALKKGLHNVASIGIDDCGSEVFQVYANYVFDFKNIKEEMDYIRGNRSRGGRVKLSKFVEGLLMYRETLH